MQDDPNVQINNNYRQDKHMKALVLAGGFPQIDLINKLKVRGIETILADYYSHPVARDYADKFYRISTLDVDAIRKLAVDEQVDFIITVCTDQALLTMAKVSEELFLPCYLDYTMARNVTNKSFMKQVFLKYGIPSAKFAISDAIEKINIADWQYPIIVKPVDCNSSKGVRRIDDKEQLVSAFNDAIYLSRTKTAIIEEFIAGKELSVDVYVENGQAIVLDVTTSEKIKDKDRFIIFRTWHPAQISITTYKKIQTVSQQIANAFQIKNSPMLIQMLTDGENIFVIEFSARTGGGVKHLSIMRRAGVDVISSVIELTLGNKPHIEVKKPSAKYMVDEYIYCKPGVFDHIEGFDELKKENVLVDYYVFRGKGSTFNSINNSGDRVGGFSIQSNTLEELREKHDRANRSVRVVSVSGEDIMRHDLLAGFDAQES